MIPCPCCACNPAGVPRSYSSLAEEAHAEARWCVFGCPNARRTPEQGAQLLVRYFPRSLFSRSESWLHVVDIDGGQYWKKCHTARTWTWYAVLQ